MSSKAEKKQSANRHQFLMETFFGKNCEGYAVKPVGNWVLVRQWNGGSKRWEVAIWKKVDYKRVQSLYQKGIFDE